MHARTTTRKRRRRSPPAPVSTCTGPISPTRSFEAWSRSGSRASTRTWRPTCRILASDRYAESFNETKALGDVNDPDATRAEIARHWQAGANTTTETRALVQGGARRRRAAGHLAVPFAYRAALCAARHGHCRRVRHRMAGKVRGLFLATWHCHPRSRPRRQPEHRCGSATGLLGTSRSAARLSTLPAPQRWPVPRPPCWRGSTAPTASTSSSLAREQAP